MTLCIKFLHIAMEWGECSEDWVVSERTISLPNKHGGNWTLCYSLPVDPNKSHKWKLKMTNCPWNVFIGIHSNNSKLDGLYRGYNDTVDGSYYFYVWANSKYVSNGLYTHKESALTAKDHNYGHGDTVSVIIENGMVLFAANDEEPWTTPSCKIDHDKDTVYYLMVNAYSADFQLEMISYE